jgi:hypothetical protein
MTDRWAADRGIAIPLLVLLAAPPADAQALRFLNPPALPPSRGYTHVVDVGNLP